VKCILSLLLQGDKHYLLSDIDGEGR